MINILVPLVMAFLSLILKDSISRWLDVIVGGIYAVLEFITLLEQVVNPKAYSIVLLVAAVVALVLIVWYAWKSKPKG